MSVIRKHTYCTMHFFFCNDFGGGRGGGEWKVNRIKRRCTVHQIRIAVCVQFELIQELWSKRPCLPA